jgi:hypothetical protein
MIADELNECTVHQTVTRDLNMRRVCGKILKKYLNDDQKAGRNEVSAEILERLETQPGFLIRVITGDESLFFEYNPEAKRQSKNGTRHSLQDRRKLV